MLLGIDTKDGVVRFSMFTITARRKFRKLLIYWINLINNNFFESFLKIHKRIIKLRTITKLHQYRKINNNKIQQSLK